MLVKTYGNTIVDIDTMLKKCQTMPELLNKFVYNHYK